MEELHKTNNSTHLSSISSIHNETFQKKKKKNARESFLFSFSFFCFKLKKEKRKDENKKSDKKTHSRRSIFGSIKVEKLTTTFGAIFNLFGHHEIHETALAPSHNQNMVFMVFLIYPVVLSRGIWRRRVLWRRFLTVTWAVVFCVEITAVFWCCSWIISCFHTVPPVYIVNLPCLPKIKPINSQTIQSLKN